MAAPDRPTARSSARSQRDDPPLHPQRPAARPGQLVLIDAGVEYDGYASDVTRTYPSAVASSPPRRRLRGRARGAAGALDASRPGTTLPEVHQAALRRLCEGMVSLGLLRRRDRRADRERGLSTLLHARHQPLARSRRPRRRRLRRPQRRRQAGARPWRPGWSAPSSPELYVSPDDPNAPEAFKGIGIRIEDDVVVTPDGIENLTREIPKQIDEIEAWVRGD
ncbi:MAG: M24 family metallopeptidase [Myxococcota bacterium]